MKREVARFRGFRCASPSASNGRPSRANTKTLARASHRRTVSSPPECIRAGHDTLQERTVVVLAQAVVEGFEVALILEQRTLAARFEQTNMEPMVFRAASPEMIVFGRRLGQRETHRTPGLSDSVPETA